ncbi:hypothetical protein, partial [Mesorhizobium sp. M0488]|uniref:hypothetical protein n=1 Tax=Mesorhizobium sp. M0488 TaxID=2956949 RepID=UPI0033362486
RITAPSESHPNVNAKCPKISVNLNSQPCGEAPHGLRLSRFPSICALIPHTDFGVCREKSG